MLFQLHTILLRFPAGLNDWDTRLFIKINSDWTSPFFDSIFPWWREMTTWYPLYLFLLVFIFQNFGFKAWKWVVAFAVTITISDQLSSNFIKNHVNRLRPCQDPLMEGHVRMLLNHCSGGASFTSSHATNHFAAALFIFTTLKPYLKNWTYLFFFWAATVSYGQVYVGVHYPLDIICGAIAGSITGYIVSYIFNMKIGLGELKVS